MIKSIIMTIGTIIKINVKKLGCKLNLAPIFINIAIFARYFSFSNNLV